MVQLDNLAGTPAFMSPEQWTIQNIGPGSDVWAVGVMLFQLCSGKLPFTGNIQESVTDLDTVAPVLSPGDATLPLVAAVVAKALEKTTAKRYASAAEMLHDLNQALSKGSAELCEECEQPAELFCVECEERFCKEDARKLHRAGKRSTRSLVPLPKGTRTCPKHSLPRTILPDMQRAGLHAMRAVGPQGPWVGRCRQC